MANERTAQYERAIADFRQVLSHTTKDDLDKPTPCASWKVRDVIAHLISGADFFVVSAGGDPTGAGADALDGDYEAAFDQAATRILGAFEQPGALDREVDLPFGRMPASVLVGIATTDTFTHAWDIAKATGQSTDLDPDFAAQLLERAKKTIPAAMRGEEGVAVFGPEQEAPAGASPADQLAAFLGRTV